MIHSSQFPWPTYLNSLSQRLGEDMIRSLLRPPTKILLSTVTFSIRFHPRCSVDRVTKQTVTRHGVTDHASNNRTCWDKYERSYMRLFAVLYFKFHDKIKGRCQGQKTGSQNLSEFHNGLSNRYRKSRKIFHERFFAHIDDRGDLLRIYRDLLRSEIVRIATLDQARRAITPHSCREKFQFTGFLVT